MTADEAKLTSYAKGTYDLNRDLGPRGCAMATAYIVGRHAKRLGLTEKDMSSWLQSAYGNVWVKGSGAALNPGADLKELRKEMLRGYKSF